MTSTTLKDVNNFKDLGVTITKDLSWSNHISITVSKANKVLGFVKRSVGTANVNVFSMLYKSLFFFFLNLIFLFYAQHIYTKTFRVKVTAPNATNLTFIVYQIQYLTTLLISPAEISIHALN